MKKVLFVLIIALAFTAVFALSVSASEEINVFLNGEFLDFDVPAQAINGRTMVPMRKIFELLGATVKWDNSTQKITATKDDTTISMQIGNNVMKVNGNKITLDVSPKIIDGRTLVPVRAVAESFDTHVIWDDSANTVLLSTYIPFDTPKQTFDYLCDWILEYGDAFANYTYIGWKVEDGVTVQIRCYPDAVNGRNCIRFCLNTISKDDWLTTVSIWETHDVSGVYASFDGSTTESEIQGNINMEKHTDNYPIKSVQCKLGEGDTELGMLEETRKRINYLLKECDILLSVYNTGVTLNTLGFKKY